MVFDLGEISAKRFFSSYWRRRPLFLKGGARLLLDREISVAEFRMLCDRLERKRPEALARNKTCIFAEGLDEVSAELRSIAHAHAERSTCRRVRFDGTYAMSEGGLGSHYDRNDSFVLQQVGSGRWRLCPPEVLSPNELRARMVGENDGRVHMPDECHEYAVEAGDLLYVPLLWGRWAVSEGEPSLTLSVVLDASNALELLLPALAQVLAEDRAWWFPLPHVPLAGAEGAPPSIEQCFDVLLESFSHPDFAKRAKAAWWRAGYLRQSTEETARRAVRPIRQLQLADVGLDPRSVSRMIETEIRAPDPETAAAPGDRITSKLRLLVARRVMSELFDVALRCRGSFAETQASAAVLHVAWALQHAELESIAPLVARPEVTSWIWRMSEALEFGQVSYFEEIAGAVTRLFFPALLTVRAHLEGSTLPIGRSHERGINLLALGRRIISPVPLGTRMNVSLLGALLRFSSAAGVLVEFPAQGLTQAGAIDLGSGFFIEELPVTEHGAIMLLERDAWMFGQYPRGARFGARALADKPPSTLLASIDRHARAIEEAWPELGRELSSLMTVALPLAGRDARAQTVPPFLGAVAVTEHARPADLVEELGRTKARLIASVGLAFDRPVRRETRDRFEGVVAGAYRRAFEELAGLEISGAATPFSDPLSPWGRAFMDAVFALMK